MSRTLHRVVAGAVAALSVAATALPAGAQSDGAPLAPADGVRTATIHRTSFGIPHIVADDYESLAFGHGYATFNDTPCQLSEVIITGRGERSKAFGPDGTYTDHVTLTATNLETDAFAKSIRERGVAEELLGDPVTAPSDEVQALVRGYTAGIQRAIADLGGADGISDPACSGAEWVPTDVSEADLYYGIYAANLLASSGVFVPQIVNAEPPSPTSPGLPVSASGFQAAPAADVLPESKELRARLGKDEDHPFGSNGVGFGGDITETGRGMVFGNPHFPWRGRYRFTQAHLTIPGHYDVAGGMLHGAPVVNIGFNNDVAWTHTVSTAYRFTPYEYKLVPGSPTTYLTESGPKELMRDVVEVEVKREDGSIETVTEDLYRTDQGFVLHAPEIFLTWDPATVWALRDANAEHLKTLDAFHEMSKAGSVGELASAQDRTAGIPWVNTMAADRDGDALYADNSVVPHVTDEKVIQCATPVGQVLFQLAGLPGLDGTRAESDCAWGTDEDAPRPGIFGPSNLPDVTTRTWVENSNDSYWLPNPDLPITGFDRIIGCEECERSLRTRMVYTYILDRLSGDDGRGEAGVVRHEDVESLLHQNRVFGAELSRENGDLQTVCESAGGGEACQVLADWDGHTDIDSVGAHIFREFFNRTPSGDRWEVAFDASRPVETPRDLDEDGESIVQAMTDAIAFLEDEGIPFDAPLGDLQVAGDDGAPAIPVGGGVGGHGNANLLGYDRPASNTEFPYAVDYGSSHVQAVAFTDEGVDASTILTYGVSTDPTQDSSFDQTQLFSEERWVDFPFTMAEIEADPNHTVLVIRDGEAPAAPGTPAPAADPSGAPAGRLGELPTTGGGLVLAGLASVAGATVLRRRTR